MRHIAHLCPGQGAQHLGMGRELYGEFAVVRATFAEAGEALGEDIARLCFDGPEEALTLTENAQPALLTLSVAIARLLASEGAPRPVIAAGHSLGEWSALVIAGALDFAQAVRAVRSRGRFMQEAVAPGVGAMSALLGADPGLAEELCRAASAGRGCIDGRAAPSAAVEEIVVPANLNGAGQVVAAGHAAAVERLEALARERKVRAMRLKVSAPFHSPLMGPARERMEAVLAELVVRDPDPPVVSNVDGQPNGCGARIRSLLLEQITAPVRWEECARAVAARAEAALEIGPGAVLTGLMRRIAPELRCLPTGDRPGLRAALAEVTR